MSRNSVRAVWPADGAAKSSGLDRVVILIVDESLKTRALLGSILSSLGVGTVLWAPNDGNAIELIHEMRRRPERVGVSGIDLIISEWDMARMDGAALLRWIRHHRESPDRFLPVIAIVTAGMLIGLLQAPATKLVRLLNEPGAQIARLMEARRNALEQAG